MKDFRIKDDQLVLLNEVKNTELDIIWDINAFYFNSESTTYKLDCISSYPEGATGQYDEIFYTNFSKLKSKSIFELNNTKYWYKIIDNKSRIESIELVNIIQEFPQNRLLNDKTESKNPDGLNYITSGLIIKTGNGYVPALLLPSNHGFTWQTKYEYYTEAEIDDILKTDIKKYRKKNCA